MKLKTINFGNGDTGIFNQESFIGALSTRNEKMKRSTLVFFDGISPLVIEETPTEFVNKLFTSKPVEVQNVQ